MSLQWNFYITPISLRQHISTIFHFVFTSVCLRCHLYFTSISLRLGRRHHFEFLWPSCLMYFDCIRKSPQRDARTKTRRGRSVNKHWVSPNAHCIYILQQGRTRAHAHSHSNNVKRNGLERNNSPMELVPQPLASPNQQEFL